MVETRQGQAMPTGSATREIDYQVGRRVEHVVSQPGSIRRLQVVAVTRLPLDPQRLEAVRETVSAAVGAVRARGDTVVVQTVDAFADPFVATEPEAEDAEAGPDTAVVAAPGAAAEAIADRLSVSRLAGLLGLQGTAGSVTALLIASGVGVLAVALFVWTLRAGLRRGATPTRDPHVRGESVLTEAQRAVALARVKDWLAEGAGVSGDAGQGLKR
jgi:flagellar M-ring protein FliF